MASGEQILNVTFDAEVRRKLTNLFLPALAGRLGPADTPGAIIRQLDEIAAIAPALVAPDVSATKIAIEDRLRIVRALRRALDRPNLPADDMLAGGLARRGWGASRFFVPLLEAP